MFNVYLGTLLSSMMLLILYKRQKFFEIKTFSYIFRQSSTTIQVLDIQPQPPSQPLDQPPTPTHYPNSSHTFGALMKT